MELFLYVRTLVTIAIIDYGVGNVKSLKRSLEEVGANAKITADEKELKAADALVLPGVGAFKPAINKLKPLIPLIMEETENGKVMLGICLGLQLYFTESLEGVKGDEEPYKGLDIIKGTVKHFPKDMGLKIPHMGWNSLNIVKEDHPLFQGLEEESYVYFVHSYYGDAENEDQILTTTDYGIEFPSSVGQDNVFATQFHPEKSGKVGLQILTNYLNFIKK